MLSDHDYYKANAVVDLEHDYSLSGFDNPELERLSRAVTKAEIALFEARTALRETAREKLAEHNQKAGDSDA